MYTGVNVLFVSNSGGGCSLCRVRREGQRALLRPSSLSLSLSLSPVGCCLESLRSYRVHRGWRWGLRGCAVIVMVICRRLYTIPACFLSQEEEAKRREMAEFQRAGEAALRAMQEEKEVRQGMDWTRS